jgi:P27 family predicted phage terminase small subunit
MPTALKLATGVGSHHKVNREEPELPAPRTLRPPKHLTLGARAEWKRLADLLVSRGVLTEGDMHAFAQYCTMVAEIADFEALIATKPLEEGVAQGWVRALNQLRGRCSQQEARLGLDPSSRSAIKAVGVPKKDEAAQRRTRFFGQSA